LIDLTGNLALSGKNGVSTRSRSFGVTRRSSVANTALRSLREGPNLPRHL